MKRGRDQKSRLELGEALQVVHVIGHGLLFLRVLAGVARGAVDAIVGWLAGHRFGSDHAFFWILTDVTDGIAGFVVGWDLACESRCNLEPVEEYFRLLRADAMSEALVENLVESGLDSRSIFDGRERDWIVGGGVQSGKPATGRVMVAEGFAAESSGPAFMSAG